jgi:hypothetical protein
MCLPFCRYALGFTAKKQSYVIVFNTIAGYNLKKFQRLRASFDGFGYSF